MKNVASTFILVACLAGLSACTSTPKLSQQPIEIPVHEITKYWIPEVSSFVYGSPPKEAGSVIVSYLVDSEGDMYNVKIIDSKPEGLWVGVVKKSLRNTTFTPAPSNTARVPVKVIAQYDFGG